MFGRSLNRGSPPRSSRLSIASRLHGTNCRTVAMPNCSTLKISLPVLAARIQDLYGLNGSLRICEGRVAILVHILAPNHRPIQITQDLSNFWKEAYPKIKQELQRKYPKHEWR